VEEEVIGNAQKISKQGWQRLKEAGLHEKQALMCCRKSAAIMSVPHYTTQFKLESDWQRKQITDSSMITLCTQNRHPNA
jgi:hypothetical protein